MGKYRFAFGVGWVVYMVRGILVGDALSYFIFYPFLSAIASGLATASAILLAQFFRLQKLRTAWDHSKSIRLTMWGVGIILFCFSGQIGKTVSLLNINTDRLNIYLGPVAGFFGYVLIVFVIAHWPLRKIEGDGSLEHVSE